MQVTVEEAKPSMVSEIVRASTETSSGKLYHSHDLYVKHQLYYGARRETGFSPANVSIINTKPGIKEIERNPDREDVYKKGTPIGLLLAITRPSGGLRIED